MPTPRVHRLPYVDPPTLTEESESEADPLDIMAPPNKAVPDVIESEAAPTSGEGDVDDDEDDDDDDDDDGAAPAAEEADDPIFSDDEEQTLAADDEEQTLVADDSDPNHRSAFTPRTTPLYNAGASIPKDDSLI